MRFPAKQLFLVWLAFFLHDVLLFVSCRMPHFKSSFMICKELDIVTVPTLSVTSVFEASILDASDSPQGAAGC